MGILNVKRAYAGWDPDDGYRILIDRLWPRGVSKTDAAIDEWAKDVTPTTELRRWFGHKEEHFDEFKTRYEEELDSNPAALTFAQHCKELLTAGNVTLIYGARSATCNHAVILRDWVLRHP
ncbi:MAG: DUF488 family protein [Porphyromonas sp.]|nr:DUF488 family protein [Porphyromonas sp.]